MSVPPGAAAGPASTSSSRTSSPSRMTSATWSASSARSTTPTRGASPYTTRPPCGRSVRAWKQTRPPPSRRPRACFFARYCRDCSTKRDSKAYIGHH